MTPMQARLKRAFDVALSLVLLVPAIPMVIVAATMAARDTGASGIFTQTRVGQHGRPFTLYKIRTMRAVEGTVVTAANDARITALGAKFRRWKVDELPQLWNVLKGDMSFVGPRPDVPGFADRLKGDERLLLEMRPGITGPATLKYRDEEQMLVGRGDPERYNAEVIWPDKVAINIEYYRHWSFFHDVSLVARTIAGR